MHPARHRTRPGFGVNADGTLFTIGNGAEGSVVNFRGERDPVMYNDRNFNVYNFAPDTALLMPLERASAFLRGTFALTDAVDVYVQALYADYSVERQLAPAEAGIALIPVTNPFIPADLATLLGVATGAGGAVPVLSPQPVKSDRRRPRTSATCCR